MTSVWQEMAPVLVCRQQGWILVGVASEFEVWQVPSSMSERLPLWSVASHVLGLWLVVMVWPKLVVLGKWFVAVVLWSRWPSKWRF